MEIVVEVGAATAAEVVIIVLVPIAEVVVSCLLEINMYLNRCILEQLQLTRFLYHS